MTTLAAGLLTGKSALAIHSLAMFQAQDSINSGNSKLLMIFVGLVAFALLVQAAVMVALAVGGAKAQKAVMADIAEVKAKLMPIIEKSHGLVTDLTPQIKEITAKTNTLIGDVSPHVVQITAKVQTLVADLSPEIVGITRKVHAISGHVEEISVMAKDKVLEFGPTISAANETAAQANQTVRATIMDANEKTRAQVERVNGMISSVLDSTVKVARAVEYGVTQPVREVSGFVSGAKVTLEQLTKKYGGMINLSSLTSLFGAGKTKKTPSPYGPPKTSPVTHVAPHSPEAMGSTSLGLPSAFGSTRRDLDL